MGEAGRSGKTDKMVHAAAKEIIRACGIECGCVILICDRVWACLNDRAM